MSDEQADFKGFFLPPAPSHRLRCTELMHENFSIVMTYAYSRKALFAFSKDFRGDWKYLGKMCFEIPEARANRAILEFATQLRLLDDREDLSGYLLRTKSDWSFGKVLKHDGEDTLYLRDLTNKILHSAGFDWDLTDDNRPLLICHSVDHSRWVKAEVSIEAVAAFCGRLMS